MAGVAELHAGQRGVRLGGRRRAGLFRVQRHRIDEGHGVTLGGQRQRVHAGRAAHVQDRRGRGRQVARQQLAGAHELQAAGTEGQAVPLDLARVVLGDVAVQLRVVRGHARLLPTRCGLAAAVTGSWGGRERAVSPASWSRVEATSSHTSMAARTSSPAANRS